MNPALLSFVVYLSVFCGQTFTRKKEVFVFVFLVIFDLRPKFHQQCRSSHSQHNIGKNQDNTYSGGVPSRLNSSNITWTLSPESKMMTILQYKSGSIICRTVPGRALKLYVHCLTWPSGLRKVGARKVPFFDFMFVVEIKFWSQAKIKKVLLKLY